MTDDTPSDEAESFGRRIVLLALGAGGLIGFGAGSASGNEDPAGKVGTKANPYDRAWVERVNLQGFTSEPGDGEDGDLYYRSDL